jgi:hypothetical protein
LASSDNRVVFREVQKLPLRRTGVVLAVPPLGMTALLVWQVVLGHPWGKAPMSNGNVVGWTIFLWLIYLRLITVRLVTEVRGGQLTVAMRGLGRSRRIPLNGIQSVEAIAFEPVRDYGGYGIRRMSGGTAYIGDGSTGVRLTLTGGGKLVIGSNRAEELARVLRGA